ncbi:hypothetical protein [Diaphorobacter aerolatus]|uniref:Cell surface protein n=1 Tax=Diaphorobacter aerolatus TaxID=1288495 RepID=A0A7H0GHC9_9BURK|nr:hypothetical protein [Diaphorobacter aerolatus]QNP47695.1 hypothetical protein H9K75_16060 [Diaphorobacter aerolatus]
MLVVPYFTTQNGNATLLSLINTDRVRGKIVKARFRGALNGDNIYDFQIFLAPADMWTANLSQNADGLSFLTTEDKSCTKPRKQVINGTPFQTARLNPHVSDAERANGTREGYLEIITLADVPASESGVFPLMAVKKGEAPCADTATNGSWSALNVDLANVAAYAALGLQPPTTGITANWTVMNVPKALSWSGAATALEVHRDGVPAKGHVVYFPQVGGSRAGLQQLSADTVFANGIPAGIPAFFDLPDLSTPYFAGADTAAVQANAVGDALAVKKVVNEFWSDPAILAATDWQLTMPTRRFALGVDYGAEGGPALVRNGDVQKHFATAQVSLSNGALCLLSPEHRSGDRESNKTGMTADSWLHCGAASVESFNHAGARASVVLSASVAFDDIDTGYGNGWMRVNLAEPGNAVGIPVIGHAFVQAFNPAVAPGTAGNFGVTWPHRLFKD